MRAGGRFTLGVGIGVRDDDDRAAGVPDRGRGARMDEQMARLRSLWAGEPVGDEIGPVGPGPLRPGGPEVLVGGFAPAALAGSAVSGTACCAPRSLPGSAGLFAAVARSRVEHGRSGAPRNVGQARRLDGLAIHQSRLTFVQAYGDGAWGLLGDPSRRAIFELLARAPRSVGELAAELPISQPAVSQHLRVLREGGLVVCHREGTRRVYRLNPEGVTALRAWLDGVWSDAIAGFHKAADAADPREELP